MLTPPRRYRELEETMARLCTRRGANDAATVLDPQTYL